MPDEDDKDKDEKSRDEIKKIAQSGLSPTASYDAERGKLTSKGKRPEGMKLNKYHLIGEYQEWLEQTITDESVMVKSLAKIMKLENKKGTKKQMLEFITHEKERILQDMSIKKKKYY